MTLFLASVTGAEEAEIALSGGADIIDLKDPAKGTLGAPEPSAVRTAVAAMSGRRPVSAAVGDLPPEPRAIVAAVAETAATGVDYVKVGLFPGAERSASIAALAPLAGKHKIIGVMFADLGFDIELVSEMAAAGFSGAMIDTARKGSGRLLERMDIATLQDFVRACRAHGLLAGLAGSLEPPDIPRLMLIAPDTLGLRGALCVAQERTGRLDLERVLLVRDLIPLDPRSAARQDQAGTIDYRLLAARGYAFDASRDDTATDLIFVHDLVLPVRIGAYAREREHAQNVRFNVDVRVLRPARAAQDMRDVLSYDVIGDSIRMIVAQHTVLLETLAERIAADLLLDPRAVRATVRIEKLDLGPGGVGVEIVRERSADVTKIQRLYPAASEADPKAFG
jgi:FolB domain-containing protein